MSLIIRNYGIPDIICCLYLSVKSVDDENRKSFGNARFV
jgi:hypothetical protein